MYCTYVSVTVRYSSVVVNGFFRGHYLITNDNCLLWPKLALISILDGWLASIAVTPSSFIWKIAVQLTNSIEIVPIPTSIRLKLILINKWESCSIFFQSAPFIVFPEKKRDRESLGKRFFKGGAAAVTAGNDDNCAGTKIVFVDGKDDTAKVLEKVRGRRRLRIALKTYYEVKLSNWL